MRFIALILLAGIAPVSVGQEVPSRDAIGPAVVTSPAAAPEQQVQAPPATPQASVTPAKQGGSRRVMDRIELDATQITGNRELPKVLYIVPWKPSDLGDLLGRPANSLLDEVLAPVDREVFRRENRYYDALRPDTAQRTDKAEK